jgi:Cu+-exporting ATPase
MIKQVFKIKGMHCTSCAFNIDGELEDTDGVEEASTNFAKAKTEVKFDPEKVNTEKIVKLIKKVGYDATLATN